MENINSLQIRSAISGIAIGARFTGEDTPSEDVKRIQEAEMERVERISLRVEVIKEYLSHNFPGIHFWLVEMGFDPTSGELISNQIWEKRFVGDCIEMSINLAKLGNLTEADQLLLLLDSSFSPEAFDLFEKFYWVKET